MHAVTLNLSELRQRVLAIARADAHLSPGTQRKYARHIDHPARSTSVQGATPVHGITDDSVEPFPTEIT